MDWGMNEWVGRWVDGQISIWMDEGVWMNG